MEKGKKTKVTRVVLFVRVSTKQQDTSRQLADLHGLAAQRGYEVVAEIAETISGTKKNVERQGIHELLLLARQARMDKVLVQEVSRLGRSTSEVLKVVEELTELGISIHVQNFGIETLLNGKRNPVAQFLFTLLAEFARLEREHLSERVISGLERARRMGKTLGRPTGSTENDHAILDKYPKVVRELKNGNSVRRTAKLCDVAPGTVHKIRKILEI